MTTTTVTIRQMPIDTWRSIRAYAALHGITTSQACILAIERLIGQRDSTGGTGGANTSDVHPSPTRTDGTT